MLIVDPVMMQQHAMNRERNPFDRNGDPSAGSSHILIVIIPQQDTSFPRRAGCQGIDIRCEANAVFQNAIHCRRAAAVVAMRLPRINPAMRKKFSTGLSTPLVASVRYPVEIGLAFKLKRPCQHAQQVHPDRDLPAPAGLSSRPRYKWHRAAHCDKHSADKGGPSRPRILPDRLRSR